MSTQIQSSKTPLARFGLSNNQLKIIAVLAMLIDHIGMILLPQILAFRAVGRLAFPIFAYMIAEGCRYTKNRRRYFACLMGLAAICQAALMIVMHSMRQNILMAFSVSVLMIYCIDGLIKNRRLASRLLMAALLSVLVFISVLAPRLLREVGFRFEYGLTGILLPVVVYYAPNKLTKLLGATAVLIAKCFVSSFVQWFSLGAIPLLVLYNGKRGTANLKYLFYIFYPAHLVILYGIAWLLQNMR